MLISTSVVGSADGMVHVLGLMYDVTDRRAGELSIREKQKQLEEMDKVTIGREERILELKEEVNSLLEEFGRERKYYS